uniref:(northern house mosquito) hypothetical protein n=1 Tax=Culex pipiens TaxID=7175 RepID=A0A8D8L9G4_CULPI
MFFQFLPTVTRRDPAPEISDKHPKDSPAFTKAAIDAIKIADAVEPTTAEVSRDVRNGVEMVPPKQLLLRSRMTNQPKLKLNAHYFDCGTSARTPCSATSGCCARLRTSPKPQHS